MWGHNILLANKHCIVSYCHAATLKKVAGTEIYAVVHCKVKPCKARKLPVRILPDLNGLGRGHSVMVILIKLNN